MISDLTCTYPSGGAPVTGSIEGPEARTLVADALAKWDGVGIIVSHDRALLDRLCTRCLFLSSGTGGIRPGGVSSGIALEHQEHETALHQKHEARRQEKRLRDESRRRSVVESRSSGRLSKRGIGRKDHDAAAKDDAARLTGKDRRTSDGARRMRERAADTAERVQQIEVRRPTFLPSPGALGLEARVVHSDVLCCISEGEIHCAGGGCSPWFLSWEATLVEFSILSIQAPERLRKLMLSLGVLEQPVAVLMDEPTNHLDLPSIEALESTLMRYTGALIVVSHDERFLETLADCAHQQHLESDC